jgi:hypothetical protein
VVSALLRDFSKEGHNVAQYRKNEDQEQIADDSVVGRAAEEDEEFDDANDSDEEDDQDEDEEIEEG